MEQNKKYTIIGVVLILILLALSFIPNPQDITCTGIRTKDYSYFNMTKKELKTEMGGIHELEDYAEEIQREAKSNGGFINNPEGVLNLTNTVYNLKCN